MTEIAARLRRERVRSGMTQPALADALGVSVTFVWMVENGQRAPNRSLIDRWAQATGATAADVLLDGPTLFDASFAVDCLDPFRARRVLDRLPAGTVAIWPSVDGGGLRLRARASALPLVCDLAGAEIAGVGVLPAPSILPVREAEELIAWVRAANEAAAAEHVEMRLAAAGARGSVAIREWGSVFVARVSGLADDASMRLQALVDGSPIGLFVPAQAI